MGVSFVESTDYEKEMPLFMQHVMRRYVCPICNIEVNSEDDFDHTGDICPACKNGKIGRLVYIDIDKNMERINRYSKKDK
jgi:hypothetical protein